MTQNGLVIFDCDGVIVDSEPIASRVLAEFVSELGLTMTPAEAVARFTGLSLAAVMARIAADLGTPLPEDFRERLEARDFAAFRAELQPVAGVREMLERLTLRRCIASSGSPKKLSVTLGATGLMPVFAPHVFSAEQVKRGKPAPDLFLFAAEQMRASPPSCVVVEDSPAGIRAARAAGMRAFGFAGGGHAGPGYAEGLFEAGADLVFKDMRVLPDILAGAGVP